MSEMSENQWTASDAGLSEEAKRLIASEDRLNQGEIDLEELRTAKQPTSDEES